MSGCFNAKIFPKTGVKKKKKKRERRKTAGVEAVPLYFPLLFLELRTRNHHLFSVTSSSNRVRVKLFPFNEYCLVPRSSTSFFFSARPKIRFRMVDHLELGSVRWNLPTLLIAFPSNWRIPPSSPFKSSPLSRRTNYNDKKRNTTNFFFRGCLNRITESHASMKRPERNYL